MATLGSMLWVCTDCIMLLANDDSSGVPESEREAFLDRFAAGIDRELDGRYGHVVPGGSHTPACEWSEGGDYCDCEHDTFSRAESVNLNGAPSAGFY